MFGGRWLVRSFQGASGFGCLPCCQVILSWPDRIFWHERLKADHKMTLEVRALWDQNYSCGVWEPRWPKVAKAIQERTEQHPVVNELRYWSLLLLPVYGLLPSVCCKYRKRRTRLTFWHFLTNIGNMIKKPAIKSGFIRAEQSDTVRSVFNW